MEKIYLKWLFLCFVCVNTRLVGSLLTSQHVFIGSTCDSTQRDKIILLLKFFFFISNSEKFIRRRSKIFMLDDRYMMDHVQALRNRRSDIPNIFERTFQAALKMQIIRRPVHDGSCTSSSEHTIWYSDYIWTDFSHCLENA